MRCDLSVATDLKRLGITCCIILDHIRIMHDLTELGCRKVTYIGDIVVNDKVIDGKIIKRKYLSVFLFIF